MLRRTKLLAIIVLLVGLPQARADEAAPLSALAKMPIREVTVFKDGHTLMLHGARCQSTLQATC